MATQISTSLVKWEDLVAQIPGPGAKLNDARIGLQVASASVKAPFSIAGAVSLEIGGDATERIDGFNSSQQKDEDGVVGGPEASIPFDAASAWLKYSVDGSARAVAKAGAGIVAVSASASETVTLCDYRRHAADEAVVAAVTGDVERPRVVFAIDHVRALGPGDALAVRVAGALTASVAVSWSDVLTSEIGTLTRLLRAPAPVAIDLDVSVAAKANVTIHDEFALTFVKRGAGYRVSVRKAKVRSANASVGITAEAGFADPAAVSAAITGLLNAPIDKVRQAIARVTGLSAEDQQLLEGVAERLGVSNATPAALAKAIDALEQTVNDKIAAIAANKIEASFSFEYGRLDENATLLEATLTDAALASFHGELLLRNLSALLSANAAAGVAIDDYLQEDTQTRTRAWGFTLGFGRAKLFSKDSTVVTRVSRTSLAGSSRSYSVVHKYDSTRRNWSLTLKADMKTFVPAGLPVTASRFSYGLHLLSSEQPKVFDGDQANYCADMAVIWGVCREGQIAALRANFPAPGTADVTWAAQMTVNDEALQKYLWARLSALGPADFAAAFAAAVEWRRSLVGTIESVARRRQLYFPIWQYYLQNPGISAASVAQFAFDRLRGDAPATAALEKGGFAAADPRVTAAGLVDMNGDTVPNVNDFLRGATNIATALASAADENGTVGSALTHVAKMSTQSHQVRATGVLLLDLARQSVYLPGLTRTLSFTVGTKTTVLGSNDV